MTNINKQLYNKKTSSKKVWFMRQAGRYLPEFRKIRLDNPDFIKLCLNSELSAEITLQPLKRFDLDAAIIFSDILIVPYALGQSVNFKKENGPVLSSFKIDIFKKNELDLFLNKLNPVYKAVSLSRNKLEKEKSLIGFVGSPWTLLVYMLGLKEGKDKINLIKLKEINNDLDFIIINLIKFLCVHIENQVKAGADVIQLFDSWAGLIPEKMLDNFCYKPNQALVDFCKSKNIPVICFPRGLKKNYKTFNEIVKPDGLNIDSDIDPTWAKENLINVTIQGGMNPSYLKEDDDKLLIEAKKYLDIFKNVSYIFNLGHGLRPETNPEKLTKLIEFIRKYK